ncbi:threonine-phosphate decarboxylase [Geomonas limicola]|uniref:threonine-phosphate decarboxylase n=1 Tax=Geomonas limicola TaxID=2740186 RepID=A0A6V8NBY3_9BACT|nr:threonine-phosphate decarboxylase CobD [Geomonas limicola]GFO68729.1 threonine-phosphate decarboxylase [Geomonas limicola]
MSSSHEHGGNVFAVARTLGVAPENVIDFSASINPLGMAPGVGRALAENLDRLLHYPDKNCFELKEALAAYHGVTSDQLCVANGSTELIHLVPRAFGGRRALIVAPAFAEYASALERCGWEIDYFFLKPENGFQLPLPSLLEKLGEGFDLLFLCNPANPSGTLLHRKELARVLALCEASRTFLVLDEAFIDFCEEDSAKDLVVAAEGALVLRSMTKFFAIPGLRLGYAMGAAVTIARIAPLQDPWSVNTAAQVAGIASLRDLDYVRSTREYVVRERERLAARLGVLAPLTVFPSAANYLLLRLDNGMTAAELRVKLLEAGVLIRDCGNFVGLDAGFFRVAVRRGEENDRLVELLKQLIG